MLRRPGHPAALGTAVAVVLAAHLGLLGRMQQPLPMAQTQAAQTQAARPVPLQVRQIPAQPAPGPARAQDTPVGAVKLAALQRAAPRTRNGPAVQAAAGPMPVDQAPASIGVPPSSAPLDLDTGTPAPPVGTAVPVYTTQPAPAATLHYTLQRGSLRGQARLQWQPAGDTYRISLHGPAAGAPAAAWVSEGGFDAAGIAPTRYTESRRGRELRATNFQREAGRITYSGPSVQHPLLPGAQDRLSWMLHLGAVLAANPSLALPGAEVAMWVVGSRGDAEVWSFAVLGTQALALPGGDTVQALHLLRAPKRPYDTQAEVWLDPARHHLPVRVWLRARATGEGADYLLERLELP